MRKKKRTIASLIVGGLALFALCEALFGRLFPFSPIVLGFARQEYGDYVVYSHGQRESTQLSYLSDVVTAEEEYHGLTFRSKPEVFLCASDREFHRLTGGKARFIATGGRLFVSRRAQEEAGQGIIDLRTYLTHEMSHCLLQQHMSLVKYLKMPRWLVEGIAMDCAGQVGVGIYPSKSAVYDAVARGVFCEPADFGTGFRSERGTAISCPIENKIAFFYSEFGCIVEFLRSSHGQQQYQAFLKDLVESPRLNVEKSFEKVFGTELGDEIARFKSETQKR